MFIAIGFEALVSCAGPLGCTVCLAPQLFLLVYLYMNVGPCSLPATTLPTLSVTLPCVFSTPPTSLDECFFFNSLFVGLPVWLSGSSGCFLFLNLLLSFFWFCEEAKHIYIHLLLGQKSLFLLFMLFTVVPAFSLPLSLLLIFSIDKISWTIWRELELGFISA